MPRRKVVRMGVEVEDPQPARGLTLPADHPGCADDAYRSRRQAIADLAASHRRDEPIPDVDYTTDEHAVWRLVSAELRAKHQRYACRAYLDAADCLALPRHRVAQLAEVSARLAELTGFRLVPVPGLVPTRVFYGSLAERRFLATQYVRHHSAPFYTPEPDIIHELIGHANMLASPVFARLYELAGEASLRATSAESLDFFSRVFWFTIEFGVVWEGGELRTYGAGLLSSFGELDAYRDAEIRPFDLQQMGAQDYDITAYQPVLFAAPSLSDAVDELSEFFLRYEDTFARREQ